jgi:hypothetical protein
MESVYYEVHGAVFLTIEDAREIAAASVPPGVIYKVTKTREVVGER